MLPPTPVVLSVARLGVSLAGFSRLVAACEWLLVVMLARPMIAFVPVLADVAEG